MDSVSFDSIITIYLNQEREKGFGNKGRPNKSGRSSFQLNLPVSFSATECIKDYGYFLVLLFSYKKCQKLYHEPDVCLICIFCPSFADGEPIKLPDNLESLPRADHFPTQRHRWNTNEVCVLCWWWFWLGGPHNWGLGRVITTLTTYGKL